MRKDINTREWNLDDEIHLFNLMCDFKPAGHNKEKQMISIVENMNKDMQEGKKPFTSKEIWTKLGSLYDLEKVEELEIYRDEDESTNEEDNIQSDDKDDPNEEAIDHTNKELDSSGLSDVETELPSENETTGVPDSKSRNNNKQKRDDTCKVDSKKDTSSLETKDAERSREDKDENGDNGEGDESNDENDDAKQDEEGQDNDEEGQDNDEDGNEEDEGSMSKRMTRGTMKHQHEESEHTETPKPKKRTRSSAKLDAVETPPPSKRGQRTETSPAQETPTTSAKRRKKSEVQESDTDKTNARRNTRSTIPATTPLKQQAPIRRSSRKK